MIKALYFILPVWLVSLAVVKSGQRDYPTALALISGAFAWAVLAMEDVE